MSYYTGGTSVTGHYYKYCTSRYTPLHIPHCPNIWVSCIVKHYILLASSAVPSLVYYDHPLCRLLAGISDVYQNYIVRELCTEDTVTQL